MPEPKTYEGQIEGAVPQREDIKSKSIKSMIVDKLKISITIEQWLISALLCMCLCICLEIQTLKQSRKSTDSSSSIKIVDTNEILKSVISDLTSLKPRLESLEKSQEDNDGIKALVTKLNYANDELKQNMMLQRHELTSKLDELKDKQRTASPSINIVDIDERLQSVIGDLSSLKPRLESLEKSQEDNDGIKALENKLNYANELTSKLDELMDKQRTASPSINIVDIDERLQSVIGDLSSLKPRLESLEKLQEDNDGITASVTKLNYANEELKQNMMLQLHELTLKVDELKDKQRTASPSINIDDIDERLQSVIGDLASLKPRLESLEKLPEDNDGITASVTKLNYTNEELKQNMMLQRHQLTSKLDERLQSVIGDLSSLKPRLESLEKSQGDIDGITASVTKLNNVNEELKQNMMQQHHELAFKLDELVDKQRTEKEDMHEELKDFETKTNKQMSESVGKLKDHITQTDKMHTALDERLGTINETTNNLRQELVLLKRTFQLHTTDTRDKAEEMSLKLKKAETELENFQTHMKTMTTKLANHDKDLDTAFSNLFNKEVAIFVIVLILTTNIALVCAVYMLYKGRNRTGGISANVPNPNVHGDAYYNPVLDKIPVTPVLRKAVGVISFSRQHQDLHRRLVESLKDGIRQPIDVVYHVILRNEDIITIPHCSLIIICIEYSARDVIIELEGFALGDCNKTTLKAVQMLGAIPVIVYDYDHRSQRLGANRIFSEQIGCATRQEELIPLSRTDRFYSVYDSFSPYQKQVLQDTIQTHVLN